MVGTEQLEVQYHMEVRLKGVAEKLQKASEGIDRLIEILNTPLDQTNIEPPK